jgi:hypothetical protein
MYCKLKRKSKSHFIELSKIHPTHSQYYFKGSETTNKSLMDHRRGRPVCLLNKRQEAPSSSAARRRRRAAAKTKNVRQGDVSFKLPLSRQEASTSSPAEDEQDRCQQARPYF